jgi:transcriptional regulator with XRE-family HTH domain
MTEDFASNLRRFRLRAGVSQNALAKIVGINASYINRLENGEREAPTRDVAHALARALTLSAEEVDRLLFSAGHVPPSLQKLGPADSTVAAVTRLLTNDRLSVEARADFRAIVETIAIRWQCNHAVSSPHTATLTPAPPPVQLPGAANGTLTSVGSVR